MKINHRVGGLAAACLMVGALGCSPREEGNLSGIPSTFTGTLTVQPQGRYTKELYLDIVKLAQRYGLDPKGDGANDGKQWQIQIYCGRQYAGGGVTARDGDFMLFQLAIYAFQDPQDYERSKVEMLELMKPYGVLSSLRDVPPLSQEELLKRGKYTGFDVTSKCSPPAVR